MTAVLICARVDVEDLVPDGAGELLSSKRFELGPLLGRAFDDLVHSGTQCARCGSALCGMVASVAEHDAQVWLPTTLVANVNTGRAWLLCEDCGTAVEPGKS